MLLTGCRVGGVGSYPYVQDRGHSAGAAIHSSDNIYMNNIVTTGGFVCTFLCCKLITGGGVKPYEYRLIVLCVLSFYVYMCGTVTCRDRCRLTISTEPVVSISFLNANEPIRHTGPVHMPRFTFHIGLFEVKMMPVYMGLAY